jgi:hypothetical protein
VGEGGGVACCALHAAFGASMARSVRRWARWLT